MRLSYLVTLVLVISYPASAQWTYTYTSATGNAFGFAEVPGGTPASVNESYDFSFYKSVTYSRGYPIGSQSSEGVARSTPFSQLTLHRGEGMIFFLNGKADVSNTHPEGMAGASSVGNLRFDFTVHSPVVWMFTYQMRTQATDAALTRAGLVFERVGGSSFVDLLMNENEHLTHQSEITLLPGRYSVRADIEAMTGISDVSGQGSADSSILFSLVAVPGPSAAGLLLMSVGWSAVRRRRLPELARSLSHGVAAGRE